jgi:hypothetical protein
MFSGAALVLYSPVLWRPVATETVEPRERRSAADSFISIDVDIDLVVGWCVFEEGKRWGEWEWRGFYVRESEIRKWSRLVYHAEFTQ